METTDLRDLIDSLSAKFAAIEKSPEQRFTYIPLPPNVQARLKTVQQSVVPAGVKHQDIDHITLVHMHDAPEALSPRHVDRTVKAMREAAEGHAPIQAKLQGWAYFDGAQKDGKPATALVALVDAPGLADVHVGLKSALRLEGHEHTDTHGFTPHITLAYLDHGQRVPHLPKIEGTHFTIDKVMFANRDMHGIPLKGNVGAMAAKSAAIISEDPSIPVTIPEASLPPVTVPEAPVTISEATPPPVTVPEAPSPDLLDFLEKRLRMRVGLEQPTSVLSSLLGTSKAEKTATVPGPVKQYRRILTALQTGSHDWHGAKGFIGDILREGRIQPSLAGTHGSGAYFVHQRPDEGYFRSVSRRSGKAYEDRGGLAARHENVVAQGGIKAPGQTESPLSSGDYITVPEGYRPQRKDIAVATDVPRDVRSSLGVRVVSPEVLEDASLASVRRNNTKKEATIYHGSPSKLERLVPRHDHGDPDVPPAVFATPSRTFALAYAGRKWGDRDLEQGYPHDDNNMVLREMRPGAFKDVYGDAQGYIHHLPESGFHPIRRAGNRFKSPFEVISESSVTPERVEHIPDVLAALRSDPSVTMHPYDFSHPDTALAVNRVVRRMKFMKPEVAEGYLKWRLEKTPPEVAAALKERWEKVGPQTKRAAAESDEKQTSMAMEKYAIGQRQIARIRGVLEKAVAAHRRSGGDVPLPKSFVSSGQQSKAPLINTGIPGQAVQTTDEGIARYFSPVTSMALSQKGIDSRITARDPTLEQRLTSGRHHASDVVDLPSTNQMQPGQETIQPGFAPSTLAYKGGPTSDYGEVGPRWLSAIPSVSAGYAQDPALQTRLRAYVLKQIPAAAQGPWTPHLGVDPRGFSPDKVNALSRENSGRSAIGNSPFYEKVVDSTAVPTPFAEYKPLPTPFRFQRVRGPNVLRGEGIPKSAAAEDEKQDKKETEPPKSSVGKRILKGIGGLAAPEIALQTSGIPFRFGAGESSGRGHLRTWLKALQVSRQMGGGILPSVSTLGVDDAGYAPDTDALYIPPGTDESVIAHEVGHKRLHNALGLPATIASGLSRLSMLTAPITGAWAGATKEPTRLPGYIQAAAALPMLLDEGAATAQALWHMGKQHGLKGLAQSWPLLPAFGTYAGYSLAPLGVGWMREHLEKPSEKTGMVEKESTFGSEKVLTPLLNKLRFNKGVGKLVEYGTADIPHTPRLFMRHRNPAERLALGQQVGDLATKMIAEHPEILPMQAIPIPGITPAYLGGKLGLSKFLKRLTEKTGEQLTGGKGDNKPKSLFDPVEYAKGLKVESEHTNKPAVAGEITRDHLTEDKKYYSKLQDAGLADELKKAALKTELLPHQQRVVDRLMEEDQPGLVVAHGLGSGKTLTSIAAQEALGLSSDVVSPASLVSHYRKELAKHLTDGGPERNLLSMQNMAAKGAPPSSPFLVVDEAHRAREPGSRTLDVLAKNQAQKRMLLTGSPFYNHPADIAPLVNLAAGKQILPGTREGFADRFIAQDKVYPGLWDAFRGVRPGEVDVINPKTQGDLQKKLQKWVDYHPATTVGYPSVTREDVPVEMAPEQRKIYEALMREAPSWMVQKIRSRLPPNKQEARQLNAFLSAVRQVSNTTAPFDVTGEHVYDPKINAAFTSLKEHLDKNPAAKAVVYSNYLDAGLNPYKKRLTEAGIPFGEFSGSMPKNERDALVQQYNAGKLRTLLLSSAGGEGLDLKGTRLMQILEPHWNEEKLKQVEGRGIRYKSHEGLSPEEQNVHVQRFLATLPRAGALEKLHLRKPGGSSDEYLVQMAENKEKLINQFRQLLQEPTQ